jgi:hypothetical protein
VLKWILPFFLLFGIIIFYHKSLQGKEQSGSRCALCTKMFAYRANLVQHMKTRHQQAATVKAEEETDLEEMVAVPTMTSDGILMF